MSVNNSGRKNHIINPIRLKSKQFFEVSKPDFLVTLDTEKLFKSISKKTNTPSKLKNKNHFRQKSINNTEEFDLSNYPEYKNISTSEIKDDNNFDSSQKNNKSLIHVKVKHQFSGRNNNKKQKLLFTNYNNSLKFENSLNNTSNNLMNISGLSINNSKLDNSIILDNSKISEKNKFNTILVKKPISVLKKFNLNPIENKSLNKTVRKQGNQSFILKNRNYSLTNHKNFISSLTYDLKEKKIQSSRMKLKRNSLSPYFTHNNKNRSNSNLISSFKIEINKNDKIKKKLNNFEYNKSNISPLLKQTTKSIRSTSNSTRNNSQIVNSQKIPNKNNKIIRDSPNTNYMFDKKIQKIIKRKKPKVNSTKTIPTKKPETKISTSKNKINKTQIEESINKINNSNEYIDNEVEEKIYSPIRIIQSTKTKSAPHKTIIYTNNINQHKDSINNIYENKEITQINSICQKGISDNNIKKINQDNFFINHNFHSSKNTLIGVCDGHGTFGHEVSLYLTTILPQKILSSLNISIKNIEIEKIPFSQIKNIFIQTFKQINTQLTLSSIDTKFSGSTCITLLITPSSIITSNLGDSRAILCKCLDGFNWTHLPLSKDHKPNLPEEKYRIEMMKGRVSPFKDLNGNLIGPMRVWCEKNDFPGLAMSRSFGDEIAHSVGVSDECEVREVELKDEDKFFVVGSDGLWEFMTGDEVTLIVKDFYFKDDSKGAVQKLFDESRRRWLREEDICDDITIIVGFFS